MGKRKTSLRRTGGVRTLLPVLGIFAAVLALLVAPAAGAATVAQPESSESAVSNLETRAKDIEAELAHAPRDEVLLANLTRTRISVANAMIAEAPVQPKGVKEVRRQLTLAGVAWSKYLKVARKPGPWLAILVGPALFQLAELSTNSQEAFKNVKAAAAAQKIGAEGRPSKNSWSALSFYDLFAQRYHAADEALAKALARTKTKFERESLEKQFNEVEANAKLFGEKLKH